MDPRGISWWNAGKRCLIILEGVLLLTSCLPFSQHPALRDQRAARDVCSSRFDLAGTSVHLSNPGWPLTRSCPWLLACLMSNSTHKQENIATVTLGWFGTCSFCIFVDSNESFGLFYKGLQEYTMRVCWWREVWKDWKLMGSYVILF